MENLQRFLAVSAIVLLCAAAPALADKTVAVTPDNLDTLTSLDEVLVQGDPSLSAARIAVVEAEDRFYERWNSLNTDRKFDIKCRLRTPSDHHSRIVHRVCQPVFIDEMGEGAAQLATQTMQGGMGSQGGAVMLAQSNPQMLLLNQELRKRTLEMLRKDPALQRALVERARLAQHYEELRKEKFKDRWIVWK